MSLTGGFLRGFGPTSSTDPKWGRMPYKPTQIEGMLRAKLKMSPEDADHTWFRLQFEGLPPIRTKVPHHKDDIGDTLQGRIQKQLRVRKAFFKGLMDCPNSRADYERQVREDPYPPFSELFL
jgi:hypothetical protein